MRIIIVGGGKTGAFIAENLPATDSVTLIEERSTRVEFLKPMLPQATIVHGDACEPSVLEEAGIANADLLVSVPGDDEDTLVVALLAKHYGVAEVHARVNHPRNEWLFDESWGVDVVISSPAVQAMETLKASRKD